MATRERTTLQRHAGDARLLSTAGWALAMQVSHPTVGAGVAEHSNYAEDPWGRLVRTLDFVNLVVYGTPEQAEATARNVRAMHKRIKGVKPDGSRYHALEPEAFAWVHATLIEGIVIGHRRFIGPLSQPTVERMYDEWLGIGELLGVREGDLPATWNEFRVYFDHMVADRLEDNETVHGVLKVLARPKPPPIPFFNDRSWRLISLPLSRAGAMAMIGMLPELMRRRLDLRWTTAQELELNALAAATRAAGPLLPASVKDFSSTYMKLRRDAIERSGMASPAGAPETVADAA